MTLYKNKIFYFKQIKIYQILTKVLRLIINFDLIDKKVKKNSYLFLIFSLNFCFKKPFFFLFFFRNLNDLLLIWLSNKTVINKSKFILLYDISRWIFRIFYIFRVRRRKNRINDNSYHIFQHWWDYPSKYISFYLNTWIWVSFDYVSLEFIIQHEIQSKKFKTELFFLRIKFFSNRMNQVSCHLFHFLLWGFPIQIWSWIILIKNKSYFVPNIFKITEMWLCWSFRTFRKFILFSALHH